MRARVSSFVRLCDRRRRRARTAEVCETYHIVVRSFVAARALAPIVRPRAGGSPV